MINKLLQYIYNILLVFKPIIYCPILLSHIEFIKLCDDEYTKTHWI